MPSLDIEEIKPAFKPWYWNWYKTAGEVVTLEEQSNFQLLEVYIDIKPLEVSSEI